MEELQREESVLRKFPKCMVLLTQHVCAEFIHVMPLEVMHHWSLYFSSCLLKTAVPFLTDFKREIMDFFSFISVQFPQKSQSEHFSSFSAAFFKKQEEVKVFSKKVMTIFNLPVKTSYPAAHLLAHLQELHIFCISSPSDLSCCSSPGYIRSSGIALGGIQIPLAHWSTSSLTVLGFSEGCIY